MSDSIIYLDNHATTRVDPRVVDAMASSWTERFGNAGSTHALGQQALQDVEQARAGIAKSIGCRANELVFTSGATESNSLALLGALRRRQTQGKHLISVQTEHHAILDPLRRLEREGYEVTWLPVRQVGDRAGVVDLDQFAAAIRPDTALATVMWANNEIGVMQPIADMAKICREHDVLFHTDATQAIGKRALQISGLDLDLLSFSAHKLYGPKGIGALYVRRRLRLVPLVEGGGQERGMRSGTLAVPLIIGLAKAVELCHAELEQGVESKRLAQLRQKLYDGLSERIPGTVLNGPDWNQEAELGDLRLPNNLNLQFGTLEGESLMINAPEVAMSSGSACTSTHPEPSHVLKAIGLDDDQVRSSLRFGLGRFNTEVEIERAIDVIANAASRLRQFA